MTEVDLYGSHACCAHNQATEKWTTQRVEGFLACVNPLFCLTPKSTLQIEGAQPRLSVDLAGAMGVINNFKNTVTAYLVSLLFKPALFPVQSSNGSQQGIFPKVHTSLVKSHSILYEEVSLG